MTGHPLVIPAERGTMYPDVSSKTHAPGYMDPRSARLTLAVRDDSSKAKRGRVRGSSASGAPAKPYRLRLHNPVTLPVDYAGKLWCEQRQEAQ
jgi:hypothetical protein